MELHYNDYNIEGRSTSSLVAQRLIADGAPITAVGIRDTGE